MERFFISISASRASTSASGTWRFSNSRNSAWVTVNRVSLCHSVSSPSNPTTRIAIVLTDYPVPSGLLRGRQADAPPSRGCSFLDQASKLDRSGLGEMFLGVEILSEKNADTYRGVFQRRGIKPEEFVMVGNSLRSDVVPVVELGAFAIHIPYVVTWQLEHVEEDALPRHGWRRLAGIREVSTVLLDDFGSSASRP